MKIGVISDTHIPDRAAEIPQKIIEAFKDVDMIIHAGDFADISVLNKLNSICGNVLAVRGNMDPEDIKNKFKEKEIINIGKFKIGIMHGRGHPSKLIGLLTENFKDDSVDMIIFGHSHTPLNEKKGNIIFFNPGSPTDTIFAPYNSFGIIEINDKIEAEIIKI